MHEFTHILIHTLEHGLHILPFLYLAFLIIEYIEDYLQNHNKINKNSIIRYTNSNILIN